MGEWTYTASGTITATAAWTLWNPSTSTTSSITVSASDTAWSSWTLDATTCAGDTAWTIWVTNDGDGSFTINGAPYVDQRTDEQKAADAARVAEEQRIIRERAQAAESARVLARDKARALLVSMLSEKQRAEYETRKRFEVVSSKGRRFQIRQGTHGNVSLLNDKGQPVTNYCGQPNGVPTEDAMLAQMLQLRYDEDAYLRHANASRA